MATVGTYPEIYMQAKGPNNLNSFLVVRGTTSAVSKPCGDTSSAWRVFAVVFNSAVTVTVHQTKTTYLNNKVMVLVEAVDFWAIQVDMATETLGLT